MQGRIYAPALLAAFGLIVASCQGEQSSTRGKRSSTSGSDQWASVDFEAAVTQREDQSLSLADNEEIVKPVVAFKLIAECDDVEPLDVEAAPFDLPVGAKNCVAKLKAIKIGEKNYIEAADGTGFTKYAVGEVGKLVNDKDAKDVLYVRVIKQLPSPLTADATVQYDYSNIMSFDTIDGSREGIENTFASGGQNAPQIKVAAAKLQDNMSLQLSLSCIHPSGFVNSTMDQMTCGSDSVKSMKLAVIEKKTDATPSSADLQAAINQKGKEFSKISSNLLQENKQLRMNIPVADSPFYLVVIANGTSNSYGFVRMKAGALAADAGCPAQGDQANFIHISTSTKHGLGRWKDTSNCNVWVRPTLEKVESSKRFAACKAADADEPAGIRLLPYGKDMKAAYARQIKDLAFGTAPKLGDQNLTFWMAGGRVFNMADGTFKEIKDIKPGEKHSILCFIKPKK